MLKLRLAGSDLALCDIACYPRCCGRCEPYSNSECEGFSGESTPALEGADVVIISAGVARKPGVDRSDLFNINAGIVRGLIEKSRLLARKPVLVSSLTQ